MTAFTETCTGHISLLFMFGKSSQVQVHRSFGHRRGDRPTEAQKLASHDGGGGEGVGKRPKDDQLALPPCLLHRQDDQEAQ